MSLFRNTTLIIILILIIGGSVRFFPFLNAMTKLDTPVSSPDPHYHLRRVLITLHNFPNLPVFDYYLSYPTGAYCIWPPLFDFLAATLSYAIFFGHPTIKQTAWLCAVYPIVYGLLVIFFTFLISAKLFNRTIGYVSALMVAILPGTMYWSRLGYFDHHITEALSVLLILYILIHNQQKRIRDWIILGLVFGLGMLLWQGVILFVGIAFFILFFTREFDSVISFIIGFLMILPFSINTHFPDSPYSYRGLSLLHLSLLIIAILIMAIGLLKRKSSLLALVPFIVLVVFLFPLLKEQYFLGGILFLLKKDPWLTTIIEFQPLMVRPGYIETLAPTRLFGRAYFIWPLIVPIMLFEKHRRDFYIFTVFLVFTGLMAFLGMRYSVWFTPLYAIILAYALSRIYLLGQKISQKSLIKIPMMIILLIVIFQPVFRKGYQGSTGGPYSEELMSYLWLRDSTTTTSHFLEPTKKPEYGIMCFWGEGHQIIYNAKRPVAASNFGSDVLNFSLCNKFFLTESEALANNILDELNCRYVYLGSWLFFIKYAAIYLNIDPKEYFDFYPVKDRSGLISTITVPNEKGKLTTVSRLQYYAGSGFYLNNKYREPYRHYRLRFVSNSRDIKIYEYVKGATIIGKGRPNVPVKFVLNKNVMGFKFIYFDSLMTDINGNCSTILPYQTDTLPALVISGVDTFSVSVTDIAVLRGDTINLQFNRVKKRRI